MKYFSVRQAEELVPRLEDIFSEADVIAARADEKSARLERLSSHAAAFEIEKAQIRFLAGRIGVLLEEIADLGAVPKGVRPALVDFPFRLSGKEVYLCWRRGEAKLTYYHGINEGFSGRKPLPPAAI
ncbi:MAG: DUF2203 family protein [Elusimicrobiota bacterium]